MARALTSIRRIVPLSGGVAATAQTVMVNVIILALNFGTGIITARLLGPDAAEVMQWVRRAPLDDGFAAEQVDESGRAAANGGDASVAGLLAHTLWYAVHALGVSP